MIRIGLLILFVFVANIWAYPQESITGKSKKGYVHITSKPPDPPKLVIDDSTIEFLDENGNSVIDADEQSFIVFQLDNIGAGPGLNLYLSVQENNLVTNLEYQELTEIENLKPGESREIKIPVYGTLNTSNNQAQFSIYIKEPNGFSSNTINLNLETKSFRSPSVKVVDYKVSSQRANKLKKGDPFDLQVLIQNIGTGTAKNVSIILPLPEDVFCLTDNDYLIVDKLDPGEHYLIEYTLVSNTNYSAPTIPLEIQLNERYGKYAQNESLSLTMDQRLTRTVIVVEGNTDSDSDIKIASLSSDVDKNIPMIDKKNPNRIALIIGNEDYTQYLDYEANVDYARNDASVFRQYVVNMMGVDEKNVFYLLDATAGQMNREINIVASILDKLGNKGELIFFYAGHGFPDENSKTPYLIPVDVDATNLSSAIKLSDIYDRFGNTDAAKMVLFLDACFSGGSRNHRLFASRGVSIKPKEEVIRGNMVVLSATQDNQSALSYEAEKHGLFTYFLLKKMQDSNGNLSLGGLANYLTETMGIESLRINGKSQDPNINTSHSLKDEWKTWTVN